MYGYSYIIYVGCFVISMLLSTFYSKSKNITLRFMKYRLNSNTIILWIIVLLFTLVAGGRGFSVGIDTQNYVTWQFEYIDKYGLNSGTMPILTRLIVQWILLFTKDYHYIYLFFSFLTNSCILFRLKDFKDKTDFTMLVFGYLCFFYFATFNMWRQLLAASIVFYASRYVFNRQYIKYSIYVLLSMLIHSSSIVSFILIPIDMFISASKDPRRKLIKLALLLSPIILIFITLLLYKYFDWQRYVYHFYYYGTTTKIGFMAIVRLGLLIFMWKACIDKKDFIQKKELLLAIISVILMSLDYFIVYAGRLSFFFVLFEILVYATKNIYYNNKQYAVFAKFCYIGLALYTLINSLVNDGYGIIPYIFWGN